MGKGRHRQHRQRQVPRVKSAQLTSMEVAYLLKDLARLGFCLPPPKASQLEAHPPRELESFTRAVFTAEGMDPDLADKQLYRLVRAVIAKAFERSEAHKSAIADSESKTEKGGGDFQFQI
jgi:hypothetical protein